MSQSISAAIAIDDATSLTEAIAIANELRAGTPESVVLPTFPDTRNGNSVLILGDGANDVLRNFGAE